MKELKIEQINVSDDMYVISEIFETNNGKILKGEIIFSYESSKANYEVLAESDGWILFNPVIELEKEFPVGTVVAIFDDKNPPNESLFKETKEASNSIENELIITKKAKLLIEESGIKLSEFEGHDIINEELVKSKLLTRKFAKEFQDISFYDHTENKDYFTKRKKRLAVIGAGKAALQVFDAVESNDEHSIVFFYDNNDKDKLLGIPVRKYESPKDIFEDFNKGEFEEIVISFSGNIKAREVLFNELQNLKVTFTNVIHKSALLSNYVKIGVGNLIFANTRIGPFSEIENNNVISAYSNIEHHNFIGSNNTYGPGVMYSGSCSTGNNNRFGSGIFIEPNVKIGNNCIIASGVILTFKVPDKKLIQNKNKFESKNLE